MQRGRPEPQAEFRGIVGLDINELYSTFYGSRLQILVERYLTAKFEESQGELGALITFWNTALGRLGVQGDLPDDDVLAERGMDYEPLTVPAGGLLLTMGVDVQHDRLAVVLRAWGRGEESWLMLFDEIDGRVADNGADCWTKLDELVFGKYEHAFGTSSGSGRCRSTAATGSPPKPCTSGCARALGVRTGPWHRADGDQGQHGREGGDLLAKPKATIDTNRRNTKAARHGLTPFMVGVSRGKDLLLGDQGGGRLKLSGDGPARFHWYRTVRADYLEQLTAEVKIPVRELQGGPMRKMAVGRDAEARMGASARPP
jgi:hypothetical protein